MATGTLTVGYRKNFQGARLARKVDGKWSWFLDLDMCGKPATFEGPPGVYRVYVKEGTIWRLDLEFTHA